MSKNSGIISITLPESKTQKSISELQARLTASDIESYKITLCDSNETPSKVIYGNPGQTISIDNLSPGEYIIELEAYLQIDAQNILIAKGKSGICSVEAGTSTDISVILKGIFPEILSQRIFRLLVPDWETISSYEIPEGVHKIEAGVFAGCKNLTSVKIPNGVVSVGNYAFMNCEKLTSVTIPDSAEIIEYQAFLGCKHLSFNLSSSNPYYSVSSDGKILLNKNGNRILFWPSAQGEIIFPEKIDDNEITEIGNNLFAENQTITSIIIPNNITKIGNGAFSQMPNLTNIKIGCGLEELNGSIFRGSYNLTFEPEPDSLFNTSEDGKMLVSNEFTVLVSYPSASGDFSLPFEATEIKEEALAQSNPDNPLLSVKIPSTVSKIGPNAFSWNEKLTDIVFENSSSFWDITEPESSTYITTITVKDSKSNVKALTETYSKYTLQKLPMSPLYISVVFENDSDYEVTVTPNTSGSLSTEFTFQSTNCPSDVSISKIIIDSLIEIEGSSFTPNNYELTTGNHSILVMFTDGNSAHFTMTVSESN